MQPETPESSLTPAQAARLLAPVGAVSVLDVRQIGSTNDVFKVTTQDHGNFYAKFHTARWYADQPDTFFVVEREVAVCELLRKRGLPLPYQAWGDYTRMVVPRSVFICGELPGIPVPEALERFPDERGGILNALGRYMRTLHDIQFSRPGILAYAHAHFAERDGPIPPVFSWDGHYMHHAEILRNEALRLLEKKRECLPDAVADSLKKFFATLADTVRVDYVPPRFTVGNCHAWHFHVLRENGEWTVQGFYDFEAVSAGDPHIDLVELDVTLTPAVRSTEWRKPFFDGYGSWPEFEGYKRRLLFYLISDLGKTDSDGLAQRLPSIIAAESWSELNWCL